MRDRGMMVALINATRHSYRKNSSDHDEDAPSRDR
jgi:hypothetical protein